MDSTQAVAVAAVAFVGSHFLLSHPLRGVLVRAIGAAAFQGVYSLVAFVTLGWLIWAYVKAPLTSPFWPVGDVLWAVVTVVMLIASILLMGSLIRNPALPTGGRPGAFPEVALGVFAITRHPMMWSFALWGLCHIAVFPIAKNIILGAAVIVLALVGSAMQDRKKEQLQPEQWPVWESKTSYLPFAAIAAGRARLGGFGMHALMGGLVVWLAATWAHGPLSGFAAGIWRWF
ncbi:NnrU family protein [Paraburkholderia bryophila]|uniref:Putative membrane protein n=1 Tax=Paraburkholderia bryophila TaxID=420952 RepID=A0A7Y9W8R8_9BURK|nr:NnrU family protein [Paraburkholderia bryophila]NYH16302.1 putative membrane protein [Paraburkholderia bryophila]